MDFFGLLTMIGGLALFLFGMKTMGDSLSKLAGGKLENVLEKMTKNPIKAVLLGAGVTAVIQSSSATTVMVVGFVNSGIMKLSNAVGVIMGANIGTTATSWILSLTGIESSNFFIRMLKPSSFSPILAIIGIVLVMFVKDSKKKDIGMILIGFAVLMFGMETMSGAVKPLANVPEFTNLFTAFENPIVGMLVGALLTAIIQSSSASVGILQAMCVTGKVTVGAALPVIMGQNIGTCITALISSIGAKKNAKRAALIHLYFNLIGTIVFMTVFYIINAFVKFKFLSNAADPSVIAIIHSLFNIGATIALLPASKLLEKLAYLTIPVTQDENESAEVKKLDVRFLERPAFAVVQCKSAVCDMAKLVEKSMVFANLAQKDYDENAVKMVMEIENDVDIREDELSTYMTKVSAKSLSENDSRSISMFSKCIVYFERISDYLKGIAFMQKKLKDDGEEFSVNAVNETKVIFDATQEIVEQTVHSFVHDDKELAFRINPLAEVITNLKNQIRMNHNIRLSQGKCSVELGMALTDMVNSLGRIAKHCTNVAEEEIALETDKYDFHQIARILREGSENYKETVKEYEQIYHI